MKKYVLLLCFLPFSIFAQVGIGTTNPNPDAALEVLSTNQGILITRIALTATTNPAPLSAHVKGMVAYNTTATADVVEGIYYNDGAKWILLASAGKDWTLSGNAGTDNTTNFLGTTDDEPLTLRVNNIEKIRLETNGTISTLNTGSSVFIGEGAGASDDLTDNLSTFVGFNSGTSNTTGIRNTAIGHATLSNNITGRNNTALGGQALNSNTTGVSNVAVGAFTLTKNDSGKNNVAMGNQALRFNIYGEGNTAMGDYAGRSLDVNNASDNDHDFNVFIGQKAGSADKNAARNVYIGFESGGGTFDPEAAESGSNAPENKSDNVFIGYRSGYNETGSNRLYIANSDDNQNNALVYGEFDDDTNNDENLFRVNGEFQIKNPNNATQNGYAFPTADGTTDQILVTDGSGQLRWDDQSGSSSFSLMRATMSNSQSLINGTVTLNFDQTDFDLNGEFNTGTHEFVATQSGYYRINAAFSTDNQTNTTKYEILIYKNATILKRIEQNHSGSGRVTRQITALANLAASDKITIQVSTTATGAGTSVLNNTARTSFSVERVR